MVSEVVKAHTVPTPVARLPICGLTVFNISAFRIAELHFFFNQTDDSTVEYKREESKAKKHCSKYFYPFLLTQN